MLQGVNISDNGINFQTDVKCVCLNGSSTNALWLTHTSLVLYFCFAQNSIRHVKTKLF